jgi:hypothetical protein
MTTATATTATTATSIEQLSDAELDAQLQALIAAKEQRSEARKATIIDDLKQRIANGEITSEEIVEALGVSTKKAPSKGKKYTVVLIGKSLETSPKALTKEITDSPEYQALDEDKRTPDAFLRLYSEEYCNDHPFNAVYNGEEWLLNLKGSLNAASRKVYEQYLKDNRMSDNTESRNAFKVAVLKK